jgi:WD40 repeat protein
VLLLDDSGAVAEQQLGGLPADRFGQHDVSISPGGRWLAETLRDRAGRAPHVIGVWDLDARGRPRAIVDPGDQPFQPVVAGDGRTLYSTGQGALRVTDLTSMKPGRVLGPDDLGVREIGQAIALSPDSRLLAVSASPEIVIVDTATMRPIQFLAAPMFSELEFAPKGRRLAGRGGALIVWDLGQDEPRELLAREGEGDGPVAFSREGDIVYSLDRGGLLTAWHLSGQGGFLVRTAASLPAIEVNPSGSVPRVSPTGDLVLYARLRPTPMFFVRDVATGKVISEGAIDQPIKGWLDSAWTPDGKVFSIAMANATVTLWEARTGTPLRQTELPDDDEASFSAFTADGGRLLVGTTSGRLHVLDASTLEPVRAPIRVSTPSSGEEAIAKAIANLAPSRDGRTALVNFVGQPSRLVDYGTGQVRELGVDYSVQGGVFSPDGRRLFLAGTDAGVALLDVARQTWIAPPTTAHPFGGWTSSFSPDGTEVASGGARWNGVDGTLLGNVGDMGVTGYSADGRRLIGGEGGGGIVQWDLDPSTWVAAACRMAGRDLTPAEWRTILPDRPPQKVCPS